MKTLEKLYIKKEEIECQIKNMENEYYDISDENSDENSDDEIMEETLFVCKSKNSKKKMHYYRNCGFIKRIQKNNNKYVIVEEKVIVNKEILERLCKVCLKKKNNYQYQIVDSFHKNFLSFSI